MRKTLKEDKSSSYNKCSHINYLFRKIATTITYNYLFIPNIQPTVISFPIYANYFYWFYIFNLINYKNILRYISLKLKIN